MLLAVLLMAGAAIQLALPALASAQSPDLRNLTKGVKDTTDGVVPTTTRTVTDALEDAREQPAVKEAEKETEPVIRKVTEAAAPVVSTVQTALSPSFSP